MRNRFLLITSMLLVFAVCSVAADVTGKWVAQVPGRDGNTREVVYTLKSNGDVVTGTQSGFRDGMDLPISEGKSTGDDISFKVTFEGPNGSISFNYKGKVSGNEMKLTREGRGNPIEITAKKQ